MEYGKGEKDAVETVDKSQEFGFRDWILKVGKGRGVAACEGREGLDAEEVCGLCDLLDEMGEF